jgi:hypothetical protein
VIFFLVNNRQMATQFSEKEYSAPNSLFLRKKNWFFGDGVARFMPTGYSFQSFFEIDSPFKSKSA